jgi:hypothetical protein
MGAVSRCADEAITVKLRIGPGEVVSEVTCEKLTSRLVHGSGLDAVSDVLEVLAGHVDGKGLHLGGDEDTLQGSLHRLGVDDVGASGVVHCGTVFRGLYGGLRSGRATHRGGARGSIGRGSQEVRVFSAIGSASRVLKLREHLTLKVSLVTASGSGALAGEQCVVLLEGVGEASAESGVEAIGLIGEHRGGHGVKLIRDEFHAVAEVGRGRS